MKQLKVLLLTLFIVSCVNQTEIMAQIEFVHAFNGESFGKITDITNAGDGSGRMFVIVQTGEIYVVKNNVKSLFLDLSSKVSTIGTEMGLLGITFHPNFESNGYFYVYYSYRTPSHHSMIERYTISSSNPDLADPNSEHEIMSIPQPEGNHNGGQIKFGPDGYLYIALGDGGSGGDPNGHGQNRETLLGSILRIDVNSQSGGNNYSIPADNPFAGNSQNFKEEIFAYGLRNPWRFSFDAVTGELWTGDVGQGEWEEVDIIESGKNYGWNTMEGNHCYPPGSNCDQTGLTMPVVEYPHNFNTGGYSITGGFVYRGQAIPSFYGKYIYTDYVTKHIWLLTKTQNGYENELFQTADISIATFGVDEANEIYIGEHSSNGKVYKLINTTTSVDDEKPQGYGLLKNYPNPFNPSTTIEFSLDKKQKVKLDIFDSLGVLVDTIYDDYAIAGITKVSWNADDKTSGVYYCKLSSEESVQTNKMMLLK